MSYILDALRKSELEKNEGSSGLLKDEMLKNVELKSENHDPIRVRFYIIFGVILFVLILLLWIVRMNMKSPSNDEIAKQNVDAEQVNEGVASSNHLEQLKKEQAAIQAKANANEIKKVIKKIKTKNIEQQVAKPSQQSTKFTPQMIDETSGLDKLNLKSTMNDDFKYISSQSSEVSGIKKLDIDTLSNNTNEPSPLSSLSSIDIEEQTPDILKSIAVNVVSYSKDPKQRFLMLDLKIHKQGDKLKNGARIVEILKDRAIVHFDNKYYTIQP